MSLFDLSVSRRVELTTRQERLMADLYGRPLYPRVLRPGDRAGVLDIFTEGFFCMTKHGRVILPADALRPRRKRKAKAA